MAQTSDANNAENDSHLECRKHRVDYFDEIVHGLAHLDTCQSLAAAAVHLY